MRILYISTVGITMGFFKNFIGELVNEGHRVDIACNDSESPVDDFYKELGCNIYPISCSRSPLKPDNLKAIKQIKQLVADNSYDVVHCHTPIAAACTRLACRKARKKGTTVFYTAHGFHFYKGAPLKNWLIFYTAEKLCAGFTDTLITINKEDYALARKKFKSRRVEYVPGVGIDVEKFDDVDVDINAKRLEIGVPSEAFLMLSVGELNQNKNHKTVLRAMAELNNDSVHYAIAGVGELRDEITSLADELEIGDRVHLLGYRNDIRELYKSADVFIHPSFREGLPVSIMEAMASGLPIIASRIRGNSDLVKNEKTDLLFDPYDYMTLVEPLSAVIKDKDLIAKIGAENSAAAKKYDVKEINKLVKDLYEKR